MLSKQQIRALSEGEITFFPNEQGGTKAWWNTAARTKHVLAAYPPHFGWAIIVSTSAATDVAMVHNNQPVVSVWITVSLTDPQGRVVAQASALQPITDYKAYEAGETNARGRLYDALGFPGDIDAALGVESEVQPRAEPLSLVAKTAANSQQVKAPTQPASNDVVSEPSLAEVAQNIGATGESILVRNEEGGVEIIPKPPASERRKVRPVAPRDFAKRDNADTAPSTASKDPPPTEAGPGAASTEPASKVLLEQVRSLAMMRGRKPAEIAERTKSKADAEDYLAELRRANGAGTHQEGAPA